jgi:hypothetical protein
VVTLAVLTVRALKSKRVAEGAGDTAQQ